MNRLKPLVLIIYWILGVLLVLFLVERCNYSPFLSHLVLVLPAVIVILLFFKRFASELEKNEELFNSYAGHFKYSDVRIINLLVVYHFKDSDELLLRDLARSIILLIRYFLIAFLSSIILSSYFVIFP